MIFNFILGGNPISKKNKLSLVDGNQGSFNCVAHPRPFTFSFIPSLKEKKYRVSPF